MLQGGTPGRGRRRILPAGRPVARLGTGNCASPGGPAGHGEAECDKIASGVRSGACRERSFDGHGAGQCGSADAASDPYGNKEVAFSMGARNGADGWYAPPGVDLDAFRERGWL